MGRIQYGDRAYRFSETEGGPNRALYEKVDEAMKRGGLVPVTLLSGKVVALGFPAGVPVVFTWDKEDAKEPEATDL